MRAGKALYLEKPIGISASESAIYDRTGKKAIGGWAAADSGSQEGDSFARLQNRGPI